MKGQPAWVMVSELVETSRLWGRTAARIDPRWVEPLAGHLLKRTFENPRWDRKRAQVVATERATLYGMPIVAGRVVGYGQIDPELSRDLFIRRALVEGEWDTRHHFFAENEALVEEIRALEERARRRDILVDDQTLYDFYAARVPETVISGRHFDRWWRDERRMRPDLLSFTRELLINPTGGRGRRRAAGRLAPGRARAAAQLPLRARLRARRRDRPRAAQEADGAELAPASSGWSRRCAPELVEALIRSLPKDIRKQLIPVPEVADSVLKRLQPRSAPLLEALAAEIEAQRGVRIPPNAWDLSRLPAYLKMTFSIEDEQGKVVAAGQDLAALREKVRPSLRRALAAATKKLESTGQTSWTFGKIPKVVALPGTNQTVRAYPSLVDEGETVGVRALESAEAQALHMRAGTRKLLALTIPSPLRQYQGSKLGNAAQLVLIEAPHGSPRAVLEDAASAAIASLLDRAGGPVYDGESFEQVRQFVAGHAGDETVRIVVRRGEDHPGRAGRARRARQAARRRVRPGAPRRRAAARPARLPRLHHPDRRAPAGRRRALPARRRVAAAAPDQERGRRPRPDGGHQRARAPVRQRARAPRWPGGRTGELAEVPWLLEELRMTQFAQALGPKGQPTARKIRRILDGV